MTKHEIKVNVKEEKYEPVAQAFERNFIKNIEKSGSQICIFEDGKKVLDLVGKFKGEEYDEESTQIVMSSGKAVTSFVAAYLVNQGKLNYEAPLVDLFPEFAQDDPERKEILVEDILRHDAGLAHVESLKKKITFDMMKDDESFKKYLSEKELFWKRAEMQKANKTKYTLEKKSRAYHATTRGYYMNQVVKGATGKTIGDILENEITPLLGDKIGLNCGKPDPKAVKGKSDSTFTSAKKYLKAKFFKSTPLLLKNAIKNSGSILQKYSFQSFDMLPDKFYQEYFELECPSFNMLTNAASLATLANAMMFQEDPILSAETQELMLSEPVKKYDFAFNHTSIFDKGGFGVFGDSDFDKDLAGFKGFRGWGGFGGSLIMFDPEKRLVFSYTPSYKPLTSMGGFVDKRCLNILEEFFKLV
eukprot:maker-scaffold_40-snap-gene-1.48-mRNA-1 protein AED:0.00 eAED:0.00 QI:96/1/1/1/1/1/2/117/415